MQCGQFDRRKRKLLGLRVFARVGPDRWTDRSNEGEWAVGVLVGDIAATSAADSDGRTSLERSNPYLQHRRAAGGIEYDREVACARLFAVSTE